MEHQAYVLTGGPVSLQMESPPPVCQDLTRLTLRWLNGYEHYELDRNASQASGKRVYRWIYRTKIAE
ncbi:DUF5988 family protein [Streptomyces spectabilis]|uniref:Uncharacterized protein n=1 Tax=Streptomyces spectabilis TaxID=68270 RepID=A0A7W8EYD4_STRST|nr:hypothetical protein [Streptomyces spectabilis]GGV57443.1 hypothetical protein GCM10010245_90540 [Streptomyces spectabilis]